MRLEEARRAKGLGRLRAARMAGMDRPGLFRIEKGHRTPGLEVALRISAALDLDPRDVDEFAPALERVGATGLALTAAWNGYEEQI